MMLYNIKVKYAKCSFVNVLCGNPFEQMVYENTEHVRKT